MFSKYIISSEDELKSIKAAYKIFNDNYTIKTHHRNLFYVRFEDELMKSLVISPQRKNIDGIELKKGSLECKSIFVDLNAKNFQTKIGNIYYTLEFNSNK